MFFLKDLWKMVERKIEFLVRQLKFTRDLQCCILCKGKKALEYDWQKTATSGLLIFHCTRKTSKTRSFPAVGSIIPGPSPLSLVKNTGRSRALTHSVFSLKQNLSDQCLYPKWEEKGRSWIIFDFYIITITSHSWSKNGMGCSAKMPSILHPLKQNHLSSFSVKK